MYCKTVGTFFGNMVFLGSSRAVGTLKFGVNRHLGVSMTQCTVIVPKNVLSGSKNPQIQSKQSYKLWFPSISSPEHQRVEAHRNSPQIRTQRVKKPQVHSKPSYKLWFATESSPGHQRVKVHRNSPQKPTQWVENPPRYSQNRATD